LIFTHGEVPETAPNKEFSGSGEFEDDLSTDENEEEDDYDSDDFY
jgi:hypothetical protein